MEQFQSEQVYNVDAHALVGEESLHCFALLIHSLQNVSEDITSDHEDASHPTGRRQEMQGTHATSEPANDLIIPVSGELLMLRCLSDAFAAECGCRRDLRS